MKILFVTPDLPNVAGGGGRRMFEQLSRLAKAGVAADVVCYAAPGASGEVPAGAVHRYEVSEGFSGRIRNLLSLEAYSYFPGFAELLGRVLSTGKYDLVHAHKFQMARYLVGEKRVPVVVDLWGCGLGGAWRDMLYERSYSLKAVKLLRLPRYYLADRALYPAFENYFVVSQEARRYVLDRYPGKKVYVVPHGAEIVPQPAPAAARRRELLFVGDMSFAQNVDTVLYFYRRIFPGLRRRFPEIKFIIAGKDPLPSILSLRSDSSVDVTGFVPDTGPYLERAAVFVAPIRTGLGLRTKIVEALSHGLPVVASRYAMEGIPARDGKEVLLADKPSDFAGAVCRLLEDPDFASGVGAQGRAMASRYFDWGRIIPEMIGYYDEILHNHNL